MPQKSIGEIDNASFDSIAKVVANAAALFLGVLVVLLEQTLRCVGHRFRQPRAMDQPIKCGEIGEALFLNDALQIEFDVGLTPNESGVAQDAQHIAVADNSPNM